MARPHRYLLTVEAAPVPEAEAMESDFVVILAALLCALICAVGLTAVARCACLRRGQGVRSEEQAAANRGLKKKVLEALPKFRYSSGAGEKLGSSECAICLGELVEGEEVRVLPQCGHAFHVTCIDTWLASHSSCPSCRHLLCNSCARFPPSDLKLADHFLP